MKINLIETGQFRLDGGAMFGVVPKTLWERAYDGGDDKNRIPLQARILLIQTGNKNILIDAGNGTKFDEKKKSIYDINFETSEPNHFLSPYGLKPSDITDVILTHLHFDHCGGATQFENGKVVPSFPNAKYYVQREQYNHAMNPTLKDTASYFQENYLPLKENGVLELLEGDGEIFPGISAITVDGHTPKMQMIKITDGDNVYLYIADLIPTSAHIPLPYILAYDNYPLTTLKEKGKLLPIILENNWTVIFEHDNFVPAGKIIFDESKRTFKLGEKVIL